MTEARLILRTAVVFAVFAAAGCSSGTENAATEQAAQQAATPAPKSPDRSDEQVTGAYNVVKGWPKPMSEWPGHKGWTWGATQGIFAESPSRIFIAQRGELPALKPQVGLALGQKKVEIEGAEGPVRVTFPLPLAPVRNTTIESPGEAFPYDGVEGKDYRWEHILFVVDGEGNLTESWTQWDSLFKAGGLPKTGQGRVHKVLINPYDPEKRVWAIDDGNEVIRIFSNDGKKLLQTIGTYRVTSESNTLSLTTQKGPEEKTFGRQTDIAWLPDGSFFVTDGYENTRVVKFDKDGKYLMAWGQKGSNSNLLEGGKTETRPGYFNVPHGVVIDNNRRVYVNDRSNHRIQIFDEKGTYLDEWHMGEYAAGYHLYMTADQHIWISDGHGTWKMLKYDLDGNMLYSWGTWGPLPGEMWGVHQFGVDQDGTLYTAEVFNGRAQKWTPKPGADPAKLVGQPVRVAWK